MNSGSVSILDIPAISGAYFFPRRDAPHDVHEIEVPGATLGCHVSIEDKSRPTLLHFHGNGETIADYAHSDFHEFAELGLNQVYVEYRGYGASSDRPKLVEMLDDGEAVLNQLDLSPKNVIAFGRSIGSLYAIELAARQSELAGLVIESGIADPAERFLTYADLSSVEATEQSVQDEVKKHFDHQAKLTSYQNPVLILHAKGDHLIDISHAERNHQWSASERKRIVRFDFGDHNTIMPYNRDQYFHELRDFIELVFA